MFVWMGFFDFEKEKKTCGLCRLTYLISLVMCVACLTSAPHPNALRYADAPRGSQSMLRFIPVSKKIPDI